MSRVKSSELPHYELLCLFSNKFSETEVEPIKAGVIKLINDQGGKITLEEYWGKRKLAYRVDGFRNGYYLLVEFDLEGPKLNEITNRLRLSKDILRHQVIKKHKKTAEEIVEDKKIAAKIAARKNEEEKVETAKKEARAEEIKEEEKKEEKKESKKEIKSEDDTRTDLKNLDEELDKIIDAANLL
ncbi:MAG: 30S ribosomal protein S6 [Candidatus Falkowbacteria bacterium]|nr:30S ribosomal protein S6 [Candidatus Falkowbacteria bacterium]